jgi:hypothetical protein
VTGEYTTNSNGPPGGTGETALKLLSRLPNSRLLAIVDYRLENNSHITGH